MAIRHVAIKLSAQATSAQKARILTLALQNVTDFSGYTSDSYIGSWLTAGNTVTVTAVGDNMPATVLQDTTTVSTTVKAVVTVANLDYLVIGTTSGNSVTLAPTMFGPSDTNYIGTAFSGLDFHYTIADSFFAAYNAASFTTSPQSSNFTCIHAGNLIVVTASSVISTVSTVAAYTVLNISSRESATVSKALTAISNFGANPLLPYQYLDPDTQMLVKPILKIAAYDPETDNVLDLFQQHNVMATAYDLFANNGNDYSREIVNGGTTYLTVGNFVFAS